MRSMILSAILVILTFVIIGCTPASNKIYEDRSLTIEKKIPEKGDEKWDGLDYIAMLAPALLDSEGKYITDGTIHSMGIRYGPDIIFTARENLAVVPSDKYVGDKLIGQGIESGFLSEKLIVINSYTPIFSFQVVKPLKVDYPESFPKYLRDLTAVLGTTLYSSRDGDFVPNFSVHNYEKEIRLLDDIHVIGQFRERGTEEFIIVRRPAKIIAISADRRVFQIQGSVSFHDMGGVVVWRNDEGKEVPIGVVISRVRGLESEAQVISLPTLIDLIGRVSSIEE